MDKGKGKQIAGNNSSTGGKKRKGVEFRDEGLRLNKRKSPGVLQFFEESAEVGYYGGSSDEDENDDDGLDFLNDMEEDDEPVVEESGGKGEQGRKSNSTYVFPKEEEIDEEEFDRIMEERYKPGSGSVRYADDDVKDSIEMDALVPTSKDPPIWKVKCTIGRERHSVLCLMHKFVELRKIGTKLQILSVFSVEHVKGFIFIEADKEQALLEACKGLNGIYATRMVLLPKAEAPNLLSVERKSKKKTEGKWARVNTGKYKGDLAELVAVSDTKRKALIKLIPRIDIQALTQKYGGGVSVQKGLTPAPRLISSSELEEFRPLIQKRRDRDTGITFEHLDGLMLKDGYLYKKVSLDSLTSWGVMPSKEEILKFTPVERNETGDEEWISEIYGEEKRKKVLPTSFGGGKGEGSGGGKEDGSSGSKSESSFELYNLVCFSRKDFGLIVGVDDKGDGYKVLQEGPNGPAVVTVGKKEMKNGPFDSKFTALDVNKRQISATDVVKISSGPSEGKQGVVRQIYRGIIFLYDESEEENGGYFCCKSQSCEKVKLFTEETTEKTEGFNFDASAFGDSASSPKSPLSPEKEFQPRKKYINSNEGDKGSMYSIGQKLRIRVGPLKGYLCRVIALRYSDVTVKLDSQHKVFTVKSEHLAEVRDRNIVLSTPGDAGTGSFQQFDMLGTEGSSGDWAKGAGTSGDGGSWNAGGASADWNAWGSKPTSDALQTVGDGNTSTWGNETAEDKPASDGDQAGGWNSWGKKPAPEAVTAGSWGDAGASNVETSSWGKQGASTSNVEDLGSWGKQGGSSDGNKQEGSRWGKLVEDSESSQKKEETSWGKKGESESGGASWGKKDDGGSSWGKKDDGGSTWAQNVGNKDDGGSSWGKKNEEGSSWGKKDDGGSTLGKNDGGGSAWGKKDDGGSTWGQKKDANKDDGGSAWGKKNDEGSSWAKKDDGGSTWGKNDGRGSSWGKQDTGGGGSSWGKQDTGGGGSSWGKQNVSEDSTLWSKPADGGGSSWGKQDTSGGGSSWGKQDTGGGGSSWGKQDTGGGSSWGKPAEDSTPSWSKPAGGSSWGNKDSGGGGSSWGKQNDGGGSAWGTGDKNSGSGSCGGGSSYGGGGRGGGGRGGGGACFKCGESGHMSRECPQGGGGRGGGGGGACYKCGESGHMARECPQGGGGGGGGGACFKCGESGHMARECPQGGSGGGGGGGGACFKCGESGHMARECPQGGGGGRGGGGACFKCGESGHMSRECPQGGGGGRGGGACFKCGESGHMSRECPQGGGGACFKCGESGHMARECPQGGGGGSCYKCGESGHFARECTSK